MTSESIVTSYAYPLRHPCDYKPSTKDLGATHKIMDEINKTGGARRTHEINESNESRCCAQEYEDGDDGEEYDDVVEEGGG